MKIFSFLKFSFIKTIRNKKNIFYILVLSFATFLIMASLAISSYLHDYVNKSINGNIGFRTINVNPNYNYDDYGLKILENNKHILENYSSKYSDIAIESSFKNDRHNGNMVLFYGSKFTQPPVIKGRNLEEDDVGAAICPMIFYPDDSINDLKIDKSSLISGDKIYNKEFTATYNSFKFNGASLETDKVYKKKFKVVGLYDNTITLNMNNECYISPKDMKEIIDKIYGNLNEETTYSTYSVVDELQNVEKVMRELSINGFDDLITQISIDYNFFQIILTSVKVILIFVCSFVCIISFLYFKKKMQGELNEIGLMKTIGYSKTSVISIYLIETFISCIISILIGLIIFNIVYMFITNNVFYAFKYIGIELVNKPLSYFITIMLITIIPLISSLMIILKLYKKDSTLLVGSDGL